MAGYKDRREDSYEIKYLRKMLTQVDGRIKVPASLEAQSLLPLLEGIELPSREERRRPRWLSLQSGVAYAAAFALIVALFYSMEIYRPEMMDNAMRIAERGASESVAHAEDTAGTRVESRSADSLILAADDGGETPEDAVPEPVLAEPRSAADAEPEPAAAAYGVGGVESVLLLEHGDTAYYSRENDVTDPDRQAPVTLEVVDTSSQEFVAQLDMPQMNSISRCFVSGDRILVIGQDEDTVVVSSYDNTDPSNPSEMLSLERQGEFVDAHIYQDIVHVVSTSSGSDGAIVLPNAVSEDCLEITAYNVETGESHTRAFVGAKGGVQLHDLNAYIQYEGESEDGGTEYYIAQISLEGMDIEFITAF